MCCAREDPQFITLPKTPSRHELKYVVTDHRCRKAHGVGQFENTGAFQSVVSKSPARDASVMGTRTWTLCVTWNLLVWTLNLYRVMIYKETVPNVLAKHKT